MDKIPETRKRKLYRVKGNTLTLNQLREAVATMLCHDAKSLICPGHLPRNKEAATASRDDVVMSISREVESFTHRRLHDLQIRSVPIVSYANVLRHFYLRVNEIIDVHSGSEQRISLRGWHDDTDLGSDRLERRFLACSRCADMCLARCWQDGNAFNLVVRNCDQSFNSAAQSFAVANFIALFAFSLICIVFSSCCCLIGLLMLVMLLLFVAMQYVVATFNGSFGLAGVVDPISKKALNVVFCPHVCHYRLSESPRMNQGVHQAVNTG